MGYLEDAIAQLRRLRSSMPEDLARTVRGVHPLIGRLADMPAEFSGQRSMLIAQLSQIPDDDLGCLSREALMQALAAMAKVRREAFVPAPIAELAYLPAALAIGEGQTISHPRLVALMSAAVMGPLVRRGLDVGTGSGYQAAVMAMFCEQVVSIEIIEALSRIGARNLHDHGITNVACCVGDACEPDMLSSGMFDAIIVAAGADTVPDALLRKLAIGGRLVMPVGPVPTAERLTVVHRIGVDRFDHAILSDASFVPLTGRAARPATVAAIDGSTTS